MNVKKPKNIFRGGAEARSCENCLASKKMDGNSQKKRTTPRMQKRKSKTLKKGEDRKEKPS
ncbi:MAG: hypothetical protein GWO20_03525 [Candidatus Korarchaeota archaeon]|nr:hypothetical protein [Candidatus Korarchaeota archaeon]NIU81944.1 hypothetical protein [Candidatus Thorarchaeota archaeon]NIW51194.1 hypothetical protein [Candidatus Korarchaeota archaeon]